MYCDDYRINKIVNDGYLYDHETDEDNSIMGYFTDKEMAILKGIKAGKYYAEVDDIPCEWVLTTETTDEECMNVLQEIKNTCLRDDNFSHCIDCPYCTNEYGCHFEGSPCEWKLV